MLRSVTDPLSRMAGMRCEIRVREELPVHPQIKEQHHSRAEPELRARL